MFLPCRQPASQRLQERLPIDGFGDVIVHPGGEARIEVRLHRVRGHGNDRQVVQRRVFAHRPRRGETIHLGHLHVHQDSGVFPRAARTISSASRPLFAMSSSIPSRPRISLATIWLASLSSASST